MTPDEQILICAVRYALGRMSYIVGITCDYVKAKRKELSAHCINIIVRDIEEELEKYHNMGYTLGDTCDERDWINLLELLKNEKSNIHNGN